MKEECDHELHLDYASDIELNFNESVKSVNGSKYYSVLTLLDFI